MSGILLPTAALADRKSKQTKKIKSGDQAFYVPANIINFWKFLTIDVKVVRLGEWNEELEGEQDEKWYDQNGDLTEHQRVVSSYATGQ